ncbi:MAG: PAS domain-containing protein [Nitrospirae bacterium]|nr:PAS domain-containing protein [Nitrospirota bacterium]
MRVSNESAEREKLAEELEKYQERLEDIVEERTSELEKAVELLTREIDVRVKAEEGLKKSEAEFRKLSQEFYILLNAVPDTLILLSRDLKIVWANLSAASGLGKEVSDIVGVRCHELWYNSSVPCPDCHALKSFQTGNSESSMRTTPDGRLWDCRTFPMKDENGGVKDVMVVAADVTEKTALQAEAMHSAHLASLGELAAGVAHEINNPLNGIINYAQILANRLSKETRENEIAGRIIKEGDRIANIVRSLLSFAHDRKEEKSIFNVREILSDTLLLSESRILKDGIKLKINVPRDLPEIVVNSQQIQQVFMNLISNARYALNQKYPGTNENKILEISGETIMIDGHSYIRMLFYDHGTGMADDILDKVMNPFFSTKPSGHGTGLGLSISHGIISDHNGKLTIESIEGEFARVIIDLPVKMRDPGLET